MDCKKCIKEDVCDQKCIFKEIEKNVDKIVVDGYPMKTIAMTKGITVEVHCNRAVKKQTEFSPGWTNVNSKKL